MQNTTTAPAALQPASLPNLWLHKLGAHVSAQPLEDSVDTPARRAMMAVFRTCTACRDVVLLSRQASVYVPLPIRAEEWPALLQRLCTVLRRSRNVRLLVEGAHSRSGQGHDDGLDLKTWTQTEPYIIHLLLCVRSKLGAVALEGIKAVVLGVRGRS